MPSHVPPLPAAASSAASSAMTAVTSQPGTASPDRSRRGRRAAAAASLLLLPTAAGVAHAQAGLSLQPPVQAALPAPAQTASLPALGPGDLRLDLQAPPLGEGRRATRLFGDYYLTGPVFGGGRYGGGLRLTSGVTFGPLADTSALPPPRLMASLSTGLRHGDLGTAGGLDARGGERIALPYVGLGYTTLDPRGGWGLSADLGLGGLRPGERLRLGGGGTTAAQVEDILNRLRLAPVLQLGVSYAF